MNPIKAVLSSLGLFSIIPVPAQLDMKKRDFAWAIACLPWVGLVIGLLAGLVATFFLAIRTSPLLAGVAGVSCWALATGGFHLDGLADTNDGLASRKTTVEALEIMKRHDIGPMGVATIILVVLLDVAALASLPGWLLIAGIILAPVVGRTSALLGATTAKPVRKTGLGVLFIGNTSKLCFLITAVIVLAGAVVGGLICGNWLTGIWFGVATLTAWLIAGLWQLRLQRKFKGLTGDLLGSIIEFSQLSFLLALAVLC